MSSNQEVASIRRVIALQSFKSPQERESALLAVQPRPFLPSLVIKQAKITENVDLIPSSADYLGSAEVVEINPDAEDQLLVEALQEYEDSKFGADTTRMDLKPPGPTSFITPALQEYEDCLRYTRGLAGVCPAV